VESVHTVGEVSVHVLDGRITQRFDKRPGPGDVRVNEEHGGSVRAVPTGDVAELVMRAHAAMGERFGRPMDYLRVDLLWWEDGWVVSELELIEPGLYLDVSPANAAPFADLVRSRIDRSRHSA
jgi:glutathione synthase/RimK-type ligase-like ATP-grasp enzyme